MAEGVSYRSIIVASQYLSWLLGQLLRLRYAIRVHRPAGLFEQNREHCLILASTHKTIFDPWLLTIALSYRHFRTLVPIRTLATQTFQGPLRWLQWIKPVIEILYSMEGVVELPPENDSNGFHSEKVRGLLIALKQGDVVAIFPEGEIWRKRQPPIGEFAPGVVYLQKRSAARIVPIAVWMSERKWPRRRYVVQFGQPVLIPEHLSLDAGAEWLRQHVLELYEQAKQGQER